MQNKQRIPFLLVFSFLMMTLILIGAGCHSKEKFPDSVNNESLAGRPAASFDEDATEEEILAEMRLHLKGIIKQEPDAQVLGRVMLYERVSFSEFETLKYEYNLEGGKHTFIESIYGPEADRWRTGVTWEEQEPLMDVLQKFLKVANERFPEFNADAENTRVNGFGVYATTSSFLELWENERSLIRGIVIGGKRGLPVVGVPVWTSGVGEPLR